MCHGEPRRTIHIHSLLSHLDCNAEQGELSCSIIHDVGRLAQLVRASRLHREGQRFESSGAHQPMATLYFLFSEKDHRWYIGCTQLQAEERLKRHQAGHVRSTKYRRPLSLAYIENYESLSEARKREWFLKQLSGSFEKRKIIDALLQDRLSWPRRGPFRD